MTLDAVLCSRNAHKLRELDELLERFTLRELPPDVDLPEETGTTFAENATLKARAGALACPGMWAIADDSGLCVDALDGAPGIFSARFAGADATDGDNNAQLLRSLETATDPAERSARFVCVLVAVSPAGRVLVAEGSVEGWIAHAPSGDTGFGYDPLFVPHGYDRTFAALGAAVKAQLSHRARAARHLDLLVQDAQSEPVPAQQEAGER